MEKVYDRKSDLTFPDGSTFTVDQLRDDDTYGRMFKKWYVIDQDSDGVTYSMRPLQPMLDQFGITFEGDDYADAWEEYQVKHAELVEQQKREEAESAPDREALMREIESLKAEISDLSGAVSTLSEENAKMASAFSDRNN